MCGDVSILPYNGVWPTIHESAFIAPGCRIIGDVTIGAEASIWYNCVVRGDVNRVVIGARSNIQDGSVIHCDSPNPGAPQGFPTIIGEDVLVGHMVLLHGCMLEDRAFVGMGAMVMNGATIEREGMLAAGALLTPGKRIASRAMWLGRPAAFARALDDAALVNMAEGVARDVENGRRHRAALGAG